MTDVASHGYGPDTGGDIPPDNRATVQQPGCTLAQYAAAKHLPEDFLGELGVSETRRDKRPAVRVPYFNAAGEETAVRLRVALHKRGQTDNRFRWKQGAKLGLYGLDRLVGYDDRRAVVLTEGESDCHACWYHGIQALGIPGATQWKDERDAVHVEGFEVVYVIDEHDKGAEQLLALLAKSRLLDRVQLVEFGEHKDPSGLHVAVRGNREAFAVRFAGALKRAEPLARRLNREAEEANSAAWAACEPLARAPRILDRFDTALGDSGVIGERGVAKLTYLAVTSRLLARPVSIVVKGTSSSGKSHVTQRVLQFFPASATYALSGMSERALAYSEEPLARRMLVIYEAAGLESDFASYLLRSLLSEGRVRYETVEKGDGGMRARLIEREGPTGVILTTTAIALHPENETRLLSLASDDSRAQTRAILDAIAGEERDPPDLEPWRALQAWLEGGVCDVVIPYATELTTAIPDVATRLRRDVGTLLSLIRAHALLHRATRETDDRGRVIATIGDYDVVRELLVGVLSAAVEQTVKPEVREVVNTVKALSGASEIAQAPVTQARLAASLGLDKSVVSRRVRAALRGGYLENKEERRGRPHKLVVGAPLPDDVEILPTVEMLRAQPSHCCTVAEGDNTHTVLDYQTERDRLRRKHTGAAS